MSRETDYERLFREQGPRLWRMIYAVSGGRRHIAEEAVAEAFARALAHRNGITRPVPWIFRTASRLAREELKRERRLRPELETQDGSDNHHLEEMSELLDALKVLSPNQRAAVVLRFDENLSVSEISRLMGISPATVRVHIHRGRARLRRILGSVEG